MPWKIVNVDGKRVSLKEAVDEIFSNQDELTNSMYVTLKLYDKGSCKIHRVSDGDKEIVTNERYVVMPWKAVNMHGKIWPSQRQLMRYLVVMNPRLKSLKEERQSEKKLRGSAQNITKRI